VLERSIAIAQPPYKSQFMHEAATKADQLGQYDKSRQYLTTLLLESPYDSSYLATMADTYARQGDDKGLSDFYLHKIQLFRQAKNLNEDAKKTQIAALRRGLIPALTRLKDYAGAVDQYIEIINRFPEDVQVVSEAALYAQDHDPSPAAQRLLRLRPQPLPAWLHVADGPGAHLHQLRRVSRGDRVVCACHFYPP